MTSSVKTDLVRACIDVFADGSYDPVSRNGGWAFVIYRAEVEIASFFGGMRNSANNAMELMAVLEALRWIGGNSFGEPITIRSDSAYVVEGCNHWRPIWRNNGWKKKLANARLRNRPVSNAALWQALDVELSRHPDITVTWCKGHSGIAGNEQADRLAEQGRLSMTRA